MVYIVIIRCDLKKLFHFLLNYVRTSTHFVGTYWKMCNKMKRFHIFDLFFPKIGNFWGYPGPNLATLLKSGNFGAPKSVTRVYIWN